MFLLIEGIKNIMRYRSKYIIFGAALILISYISNTFIILLHNYKRITDVFYFDNDNVNHYMFFLNRYTLFSVLLIVLLSVSGLVIIYISVLSINSRKYDLGVLLSMGISKIKMILIVLYENCIFISMSIFIGYILTVILSLFTLQYYDSQLFEIMGKLDLKVIIPIEAFLFSVVGSLMFTIIPLLIYSVYIFRFSPYKILQNK